MDTPFFFLCFTVQNFDAGVFTKIHLYSLQVEIDVVSFFPSYFEFFCAAELMKN